MNITVTHVALYVNTYGTSRINFSDGDISEMLIGVFDLRPYSIEKLFDLRKPIYLETAAYGHMGRKPQKVKKTFVNSEKKLVEFDLELFNSGAIPKGDKHEFNELKPKIERIVSTQRKLLINTLAS